MRSKIRKNRMKNKKFYGGEYDYLTDSILLGSKRKKSMGDNESTSKCYVTSNEYLSEYLSKIKFRGKRVLTVGSSGDQALNAIFYGAKDVVVVDANPLARAYIEYKIALIKNFDEDSIIDLLSYDRKNLFSSTTYKKLSHSLSKDVQELFDRIILESSDDWQDFDGGPNCNNLQRNILQDYFSSHSDFYKNREDLEKLKDILTKGDYHLTIKQGFVKDFPKIVDGKFDVILLSNIKMYFNPIREALEFKIPLRKLYKNNLNDGGVIQFEYNYNGIEWLPEKKEKKQYIGKKTTYYGTRNFYIGVIQKGETEHFME